MRKERRVRKRKLKSGGSRETTISQMYMYMTVCIYTVIYVQMCMYICTCTYVVCSVHYVYTCNSTITVYYMLN